MAETIGVDIAGAKATIELRRPEVHNAFDDRMIAELTEAFGAVGGEAGVRVVVLRAAGKSFSAGADMNWMRRMKGYSVEENERDAMALAQLFQAMRRCPKPIVARVHGAALGGGVGLLAASDMAVGVLNAKFGITEVRIGLNPSVISPHVIERIGMAAARRYMLTGDRFDGEEAERIGLLTTHVADEETLDAVIEALVDSVLRCGPQAVAACKKLINDVAHRPLDDTVGETARRIAALRVTDEAQEGLSAFLEKRAPKWAE